MSMQHWNWQNASTYQNSTNCTIINNYWYYFYKRAITHSPMPQKVLWIFETKIGGQKGFFCMQSLTQFQDISNSFSILIWAGKIYGYIVSWNPKKYGAVVSGHHQTNKLPLKKEKWDQMSNSFDKYVLDPVWMHGSCSSNEQLVNK